MVLEQRKLAVTLVLGAASFASAQDCELTSRPPTQARYLKFCQDYNNRACCIPGHDLENQVQFENLIDGLGPGCKNPMMYPEIRYFYCLGCDPEQPTYTDGDTIRVCRSFVDRMWRDPTFDDCGVMKSNDCPTNWADANFDPYQCGDDLILPKQEYDNNVTLFINAFKPPGLDDKYFAVVDDDHPGGCWSAPAFQSAGALRFGSSRVLTTLAVTALGFALRSWL